MAEQDPVLSLYGDGGKDTECPICLEIMPPYDWHHRGKVRLVCCGNHYCTNCAQDFKQRIADVAAQVKTHRHDDPFGNNVERERDLMDQFHVLMHCPLCRRKKPSTVEEIFQYTLRRAQSGDRQLQYSLGQKYEYGHGVEIDLFESNFWFKSAAEKGVVAAMYSYGINLELGRGCQKSQSEAVYWMEKSAHAGFPPAQYQLAIYYDGGIGVEQNNNKAFRLLKCSYDQGYKMAQTGLGYKYMHGDGVEKDVEKAIPLLKAAAGDGHAEAQYHLGMLFMSEGDIDRCRHWIKKAADNEYPPAEALYSHAFFVAAAVQNELKKLRLIDFIRLCLLAIVLKLVVD